jgi:hypothetical protein
MRTLRLDLRINRRVFRVQAALLATLYVFLCTFGAVTHVHVLPTLSVTPAFTTAATTKAATNRASFAPDPHCLYCEWQASSVSAALPPQTLIAPPRIGYATPSYRLTVVSFDPPQSSSRAPPFA